MTTTTALVTSNGTTDRAEPLRRVLRLDVAACAIPGIALVALARPVADLLDVDDATPIVVAGAFLVVLAVDLALLARSSTATLLRLTPWSAAGDVAWAVGSVALALLAPLSGIGRALLVGQGLAVAGMAAAKLAARRSALDG